MSVDLDQFFSAKKQQSDTAAASVDWNGRKQEWLGAIDQLYQTVGELLSEPLHKGLVRLSKRKKAITESYLGQYEADELLLNVGDEEVVFSPKGRNVVGASGRVDVRGETGEAMLVLQTGPRWALVSSKYPQLKTVPLDAASFGEALRAVMRP
jgi:hypothetical protein